MNDRVIRYWYVVWIIDALLAAGLFGFHQIFIAAEEARIEALRQEIAVFEKDRRLLKEREKLFASWQAYQNRFDTFFFARDRLVAWLEFLEREARARNLNFEASSLDEKNAGSPPYLRVTLQGSAADTMQFLRAIEAGPYGIGVKEGVMRKSSSLEERVTQLTFILYEASL